MTLDPLFNAIFGIQFVSEGTKSKSSSPVKQSLEERKTHWDARSKIEVPKDVRNSKSEKRDKLK